MAAPCEGTVALSVPAVVPVVPVQRFFVVYDVEPPRPRVAVVVLTVAAAPPRLNSTAATDPSLIGFAHTSVSPLSATRRPWEPPQSWLTAITSALRRTLRVAAETLRRSLPSSSGEASTDHREKCATFSSCVSGGLPTSSMSGSL